MFTELHTKGLPRKRIENIVELDFSFNQVRSQEDLFEAVEMKSLRILIVTGNKFCRDGHQDSFYELEDALLMKPVRCQLINLLKKGTKLLL